MLKNLLRPAVLFSHLLVLTVVVTCVLLGQWQLDRLAQVRANNALLEKRLAAAPLEPEALVTDAPDAAALEFRRVTARGRFRPEQEVLQRNRSHQGQTGFHVLTPFELDAGGVVLVRRGFVPSELDEPPVAEAAPPTGTVTLDGILERPVSQPSGFGPKDPDDGVLARVFHADTARLDRQIDGDLYPMVLRVQTDDAVAYDALPVPPGPPVLDEANHFSYAIQWHAFGMIALVTYVAWLYQRERRRRCAPDDVTTPPPPAPAGVAG